jgi:hypothetical protein
MRKPFAATFFCGKITGGYGYALGKEEIFS